MRGRREIVVGTLVLLASRLATLPRSLWEFDEPLFIEAVRHYEPLQHHPPPPGYPVFVALAKLLNFALRDPFTSLVAISLLGTIVGFVALAVALGRLAGNERSGLAASLFFYFSPVMLVHSVLPISDPAALGLLFLALFSATQLLGLGPRPARDLDAVIFGGLAALTIGCRPQLSIAILPMMLGILIAIPWRRRIVVAGVFAAVCLVWFVPLVLSVGGLRGWWDWLTGQAGYFAAHDAAISRGGWSGMQIGLRFVAHPWGPKWLSVPLLLAAAVGIVTANRLRLRGVALLGSLCIPYLIFALLMMDPADGPRYALPSLPLIAFLAVIGLERLGGPRLVLVAWVLFAGGAAAYVGRLIMERRYSPSPPVQAAEFANRTLPADAVIAYELPLWPHAKLLLTRFTTMRIDDALHDFAHHPEVPLFLYADGEGHNGAQTFRWEGSDAYGKLTRNHYRVVSIIPIPPENRYRPIVGVYLSERTVAGEQWRWLDQQAELELPDLGAKRIAITLGLSRDFPFESNRVDIFINEKHARTVTVKRGQPEEVLLDLQPGRAQIKFVTERAFVPAARSGSLSRDPRRVAVQLLRVQQL